MKKIYILLMQTGTIPAKLVSFFTRYKYGHVAISLEKSCYTTYSFGRRKLHSIINGGFVEEKQDGPFFTYFNNTMCNIYELPVTEEQYEKIKETIKKIKNDYDNYKYDYLGLIPRFFGITIKRKNKYVCSNFVAKVLEITKIYKFSKDSCLVKPEDFLEIPGKELIYDGLYKDWRF